MKIVQNSSTLGKDVSNDLISAIRSAGHLLEVGIQETTREMLYTWGDNNPELLRKIVADEVRGKKSLSIIDEIKNCIMTNLTKIDLNDQDWIKKTIREVGKIEDSTFGVLGSTTLHID